MMRFNTCQCPKDAASMKTVYTGVHFTCNDQMYTGDMFCCRFCCMLSIYGIPNKNGVPIAVSPSLARELGAVFCGTLVVAEPFSRTGCGIIELTEAGVAHLHRWDPWVLEYAI
jgi:hypothetical protein